MPSLAFRLSGLAACLASGALALRQTAEPSGGKKCNPEASDPRGTLFLVDNSKLNAKTRGLSFRFSKNHQDRDAESVAFWGMEVVGRDEGDGWVSIGGCFLPLMLKDVPVLRSLGPESGVVLSQQAQLEQELTEASEVTEAVAAKLNRSQAAMGRLNAELQTERTAHQESQEKLKAAEASIRDLEQKLAKLSELKKHNDALNQTNAVLTQTNAELRKHKDALNQTNIALNQTNADLQATNKNLTTRNTNLTAQLGQVKDEKAAAQALAEDYKAKFDKKDEVQKKTAALVTSLQEQFEGVQADAEQRVKACEKRLPAKESGAIAASSIGLSTAGALLFAALVAA
mmetsp:Transcript_91312/g.289460  ORF Transcript_91312/g.289460 Transcript_91312/m.289460 type:complete len:343 (+) Transcript_91312:54-1082(+)